MTAEPARVLPPQQIVPGPLRLFSPAMTAADQLVLSTFLTVSPPQDPGHGLYQALQPSGTTTTIATLPQLQPVRSPPLFPEDAGCTHRPRLRGRMLPHTMRVDIHACAVRVRPVFAMKIDLSGHPLGCLCDARQWPQPWCTTHDDGLRRLALLVTVWPLSCVTQAAQ